MCDGAHADDHGRAEKRLADRPARGLLVASDEREDEHGDDDAEEVPAGDTGDMDGLEVASVDDGADGDEEHRDEEAEGRGDEAGEVGCDRGDAVRDDDEQGHSGETEGPRTNETRDVHSSLTLVEVITLL